MMQNNSDNKVQQVLEKIEAYILPRNIVNNNDHVDDDDARISPVRSARPSATANKSPHNIDFLNQYFVHLNNKNQNKGAKDLASTPLSRLESTLHELSIGDHIRALQTMYRDIYDEQLLGRELRGKIKGLS